MNKGMISASMMCADLVNLKETIKVFEEENVEYLHIDVMDGEFVPNFGLGVDYIRALRGLTNIPLDLHLMKFSLIRTNDDHIIHISDIMSSHKNFLNVVI